MTLHHYARMLFRSHRIRAFQEAVEEAVEPGMRVLDLGTGLGTYAFFAARAGARVTAVDEAPVVHLARTLAMRNGLADRIEFLQASAPDGLPDRRWDLVIFEDFPTTLLDQRTWRLLETVARRHLETGGAFLPTAARLTLTPVAGSGWGPGQVPEADEPAAFGLDWEELRTHLANAGRRVGLPETAVPADAEPGPRIPLLPIPGPEALAARARWTASGEPLAALVLWFDLEAGEGRWISNRPGAGAEPWGQWLLPVDPPLEAPEGAEVEASVWREEAQGGAPGWMAWSCSADGAVRRGHEFAGMPLSLEDLREGGAG